MIYLEFYDEGRAMTLKKHEPLELFACSVVNALFPRPYKRDICIGINFTKDIDTYGYCMQESEDLITIDINKKYSIDDKATTIAHELVHARQFIRGLELSEEEAYTLEVELTEELWV